MKVVYIIPLIGLSFVACFYKIIVIHHIQSTDRTPNTKVIMLDCFNENGSIESQMSIDQVANRLERFYRELPKNAMAIDSLSAR